MRIIVDELTLAKNQYNDANAEFETLAYDAVDFTDAERTTNTTEEIAQETALLNETSLKLFGKTVFELDDTEKQFLEKLLNAVTNEDGKFEEEEWGNFQDVFSDNIPKNEQSNEVPAKFSNKDEYLEYLFQNYSSLSEEDRAIADKHLEEEKIKEEQVSDEIALKLFGKPYSALSPDEQVMVNDILYAAIAQDDDFSLDDADLVKLRSALEIVKNDDNTFSREETDALIALI